MFAGKAWSLPFSEVRPRPSVGSGLSRKHKTGLGHTLQLFQTSVNYNCKKFYNIYAQNNGKILLLLLKNTNGFNGFDLTGKLPIHTAAEGGNLEAVQTLVESGADINALSFYNLNALQVAEL